MMPTTIEPIEVQIDALLIDREPTANTAESLDALFDPFEECDEEPMREPSNTFEAFAQRRRREWAERTESLIGKPVAVADIAAAYAEHEEENSNQRVAEGRRIRAEKQVYDQIICALNRKNNRIEERERIYDAIKKREAAEARGRSIATRRRDVVESRLEKLFAAVQAA